MVRDAIIAIHLLLFTVVSPTLAQQRGAPQRGGDQRGGDQRGGDQVPAPGTMLPVVAAYDEQGERFSTASLRGSYTVLVFGCLT